MTAIASVLARQVLDSRGLPTLEVEVRLEDGCVGRAIVPAGGSRGRQDAFRLHDDEQRPFGSRGVGRALAAVAGLIHPALRGFNSADQTSIDTTLLELDGTDDKRTLGANTILGVSMASARAAAASARVPLYEFLGGAEASMLPTPMFNVLNGGAHADDNVDLEEFMVVPVGAPSLKEAVRWGVECYRALGSALRRTGRASTIGDDGGFAPRLSDAEEAVELVLAAVVDAGFDAGREVVLAIDAAANALYDGRSYRLSCRRGRRLSSSEMAEFWAEWVRKYPIAYIEDGVADDDESGWNLLTRSIGRDALVAGDDVFGTDPDVLSAATTRDVANAVVVKVDQIGTITEALDFVEEATSARYATVVSHRSGDTTDDFIADLAVATRASFIKSGAPCRGECVEKYNRLLRIEEALGTRARFAGGKGLRRSSQGGRIDEKS